jgi:hypothetical protein
MTWEPTNELRHVRRKIMRSYPKASDEPLGYPTIWFSAIEETHLVLQQKWVWKLGDATQVEWRDVPEEKES